MAGFTVSPWDEIEDFFRDLIDSHGMTFVGPMLELTHSVIKEGADARLAGHTSMHDLVVTTAPVSDKPNWLRISLLPNGRVRVAHQTIAGPGDSIERPVSDLLPLFWRFAIEKWGIRPVGG